MSAHTAADVSLAHVLINYMTRFSNVTGLAELLYNRPELADDILSWYNGGN